MKIAFYKAKHGSLIDKAINWCSGRDGFSHVEFAFSDGMFFGSSGEDGGVRFKQITPIPEHWEILDLRVSVQQECAIRKWCRMQAGEKYDWGGVLGFILPTRHMAGRWFCSAICCGGLESESLIGKIHSWQVSPNELYLILKATKLVG